MRPVRPANYAFLFPALHDELLRLLRGLGTEDWHKPTWAPRWSVRDVVAHLLDGDIRRLSIQRDRVTLPPPPFDVSGYRDLVRYLDDLNAEWVRASARISPPLLVDFLAVTGPQLAALVASLDPEGRAIFPVAWAGEDVSANWLDIGREYTERWHHQQQVRDAVGAEALTAARWLGPVIDISMRALPRTYRDADAPIGSSVTFEILGDAGGVWSLVREPGRWLLVSGEAANAITRVTMEGGTAWKAFFQAAPARQLVSDVNVTGDERLGVMFFDVAAVMV